MNNVQQQEQGKSPQESSVYCFCCCTVPVFEAAHLSRANIFIPGDLYSLPRCPHFPP